MYMTATVFLKVRIMWEFIIPFLIVYTAFILGVALYNKKQMKIIVEKFKSAEYEGLIPLATKMKRKYGARISLNQKNIVAAYDTLSYILAVSMLATQDDTAFLKHVQDIRSQKMQIEKHFLLTVFYLKNHDTAAARKHHEAFLFCTDTPSKSNQAELLSLLFDCASENDSHTDSTKAKLCTLENKFQHPFMKQLVQDASMHISK